MCDRAELDLSEPITGHCSGPMDDIEKRILIAVLMIILVILSIAAMIWLSIPSSNLGHPQLEGSMLTLGFFPVVLVELGLKLFSGNGK